MQNRNRSQLLGLFLVLVAACSSGGDSPAGPGGSTRASLTGHWQYTDPNVPLFPWLVDLNLTETGTGAITGSGQVEDDRYTNVVVTGQRSGSTVTMTISGAPCTQAQFSGTVTDNNTISGTNVTSSGYGCRAGSWTLKRK